MPPTNVPTPLADPNAPAVRARKSYGPWIILSVVILLPLVGSCGGFAFFMFHVWQAETAAVRSELSNHPEVVRAVGEITEFSMDLSASMNHEDPEAMVYRVRGNLGEARITAVTAVQDQGELVVVWAELETSSGDVLTLQSEADYLESLE